MSNRRQSDRVDVEVPIEIIGADLLGTQFFKQGVASVISRNGAGIQVDFPLLPGQVVIIRNLNNSKEREGTIVGLVGQGGNVPTFGMRLSDPDLHPWDLAFPEVSRDQAPLVRIVLACKLCDSREVVHLDEIQTRVLETSERLERACTRCRIETFWCRTSLKKIEGTDQGNDSSQTDPEARYRWQRKYKRVPTTFPACVRLSGPPGEIVFCENISRGGLCFRSLNRYSQGSQIEVAVPYDSRGGGNIFVSARVLHVALFGKLFRHGAEYL